jgi:transcriptional regulator with XRE-family HTH domain
MSTRDMFYPKGTDFSNAEERAFAKEELVYNVTEDLLVILEDTGVSKVELAKKLGKSKSYVSQVLSGARNMTLGTLSDICFALGFKPEIKLPVGECPIEQEQETGRKWEQVKVSKKNVLIDRGVIIERTNKAYWNKEVA